MYHPQGGNVERSAAPYNVLTRVALISDPETERANERNVTRSGDILCGAYPSSVMRRTPNTNATAAPTHTAKNIDAARRGTVSESCVYSFVG